jgi:hypothetical protein
MKFSEKMAAEYARRLRLESGDAPSSQRSIEYAKATDGFLKGFDTAIAAVLTIGKHSANSSNTEDKAALTNFLESVKNIDRELYE